MKRIATVLMMIALSGCAVSATHKLQKATSGTYVGEPIESVISGMTQHGLFCQRRAKLESDPRLKAVTDGTLNEVEFYECIAFKDSGLCVHNASTYVLSQYGKLVRINGSATSKSCLWDDR